MAAVSVVFAALVGAALGSFFGVVPSRGWHASLRGRSHCDRCGRTLAWFELIPLVSYPALRGRCRSCGTTIGWSPLLWEVGGAATAAGIVLVVLLATR